VVCVSGDPLPNSGETVTVALQTLNRPDTRSLVDVVGAVAWMAHAVGHAAALAPVCA
jgi:hypothetical protein